MKDAYAISCDPSGMCNSFACARLLRRIVVIGVHDRPDIFVTLVGASR